MTAIIERIAAMVVGILAVAVVVWVGTTPGGGRWVSMILAAGAAGAAAALLWWLATDPSAGLKRLSAWAWGGGAALVLGWGSMLDFELWFTDSRGWTVGCHVLAVVLVILAGRRGGWAGSLRAALVAHLGSTVGILATFRLHWRIPEQTAVFQAAGLLDAYETSGGADFWAWVTDAYLGAVLPRTVVALVIGAGIGWCWSRFSRG